MAYHILNNTRFNAQNPRCFVWVDFGPNVEIIATSGIGVSPSRAVFRIKGHASWSSIGRRTYRPATYILAAVQWDDDPSLTGSGRIIEVLAEAKPGAHWRALLSAWYEALHCAGLDLSRQYVQKSTHHYH